MTTPAHAREGAIGQAKGSKSDIEFGTYEAYDRRIVTFDIRYYLGGFVLFSAKRIAAIRADIEWMHYMEISESLAGRWETSCVGHIAWSFTSGS